jgi:predicted alpha/beta superfamily hydrolase
VLSFVMPLSAHAQQRDSTKLTVADIVTIHSQILNQDRKLYIYTPHTISTPLSRPGPAPYPVMYLLDGEVQIQMVAGLVDYLSNLQAVIPSMIVVGIDNNDYDRERDLTPTHSDRMDPVSKPDTSDTAFTKTSGGGEQFLRFIRDEVMPYVEQHYSTAPFRILSGHSLGGLMSVYCLLNHPEMFNAYIGISPSIWWDEAVVAKQAKGKLKAGAFKNRYLFFSISSEGGEFYQDIATLHSAFRETSASSGLTYRYVHYPAETHGSSPARAEYDALRFLFPKPQQTQ